MDVLKKKVLLKEVVIYGCVKEVVIYGCVKEKGFIEDYGNLLWVIVSLFLLPLNYQI